MNKKIEKQYRHGGPEWSDLQSEALQRLASEGVYLQVRSVPSPINEDTAAVTVLESKSALLQFRELEQAEFKEVLLYTNNPTHPYKPGSGTGTGSVKTTPPNTGDSKVNADSFPNDDDLPRWLKAVPANTMLVRFESEDAYKMFIKNNAQTWGLKPLAMYSDMANTSSYFVLFRKTGLTPISALDDEPENSKDHSTDQNYPTGPNN